ncbi:hypothetical protein BN439_3852 [Erwinia amylovora Ea644]|nr:hypothetical protein BN439_3852 [Erwinia amylovora Ea644]CCP08950.1 hypothetical protein BN440_3966 [Erwinia amylovora MR1]
MPLPYRRKYAVLNIILFSTPGAAAPDVYTIECGLACA